ncbi:MAG: aminotransferase class V-fold PLP-dependent enzyme [Candidatus Latescibacteria bacterium]|nr:aminotransferase class V-fold PLP-dependent enzyme [Candidatus Latescibacterota bacterium]
MSIYDEIGIPRIINASGSMTYLGGSLMAPEVRQAMDQAAQAFVPIDQLMAWAGSEIARHTGAEAGLVTTGTAGGLLLAGAACITGQDRQRMLKLPDTKGLKNEIIVQKPHRISFEQAVRSSGAQMVEIGATSPQVEELEAAFTQRTAAVLHMVLDPQPVLPLGQVIEIAHARNVPVIVDAAAELPPVANLKAFVEAGADLVIFSGGKEISGPNDSGILCGRRELVEAAALQAFPNAGIGRPLKVGKEQIVGLVYALRRFAGLDYNARLQNWRAVAEKMSDGLQGIAGAQADVTYAIKGARPISIPRTRLQFDPARLGISPYDLAEGLEQAQWGGPAIALGSTNKPPALWLNPQHLVDGEEDIVVEQVGRVLRELDGAV